jgi:cytochrome P450
MVDEIKNLPDNELAFMEEIYLRMHGRYTTIGEPHPEAILAIKGELTRGIARTLADLQDEVTYAVDTEIGDAKEWKELYVVAKLLRIVALVSGRIFVGLPLCRNEQWINTTINFTVDLMHAVRDVEAIHPLLRPFRAPFLKTIRQITTYRKLAGSMLAPQFKEILAERAAGQEKAPVLKGEDDSQFNLAQWILNHYKNPGSATAEKLGEEQLSISFAAIHTTTMGGSNALFDLAAHPQYIKPLREEIESVIAEEGYADGRLLKTSMPKLRKLDSFIRESQRINPPAMCKFYVS